MPPVTSARRSASGRGRVQSVDDLVDNKDARIANLESEAELRITGGGWVRSIREGLALLKHQGKTLPINTQNLDPGPFLEVMWRGRTRLSQRNSQVYQEALDLRSYVERAKPPLTDEQLQDVMAQKMLKQLGVTGVNLTVIDADAREREAISDAFAGISLEDRLRWLIMHCHVTTNVRPHGFASVGKLSGDSPLAQLMMHGLQLFMAVTFDDGFARQLHQRHFRTACVDPLEVQSERLRQFYYQIRHNRAKLPPAGTQAPVFDHCSLANQMMFVNQVVEGLLLPDIPLPPDSVYCWSAFNKLLGLGLMAPIEEAAAAAGDERAGSSATLAAAAADLNDLAAARQVDAAAATSLMAAAASQLRVSLHDMIQQQQQLGAAAMQALTNKHSNNNNISNKSSNKCDQQQQLEVLQQQSDLAALLGSSSSSQRRQQLKLQSCISTAWPLLLNVGLLCACEFDVDPDTAAEMTLQDAVVAAAAAATGMQGSGHRHCHVGPQQLLAAAAAAAAANGSSHNPAAAAAAKGSSHDPATAAAAVNGSSHDSAAAAAAAATGSSHDSAAAPAANGSNSSCNIAAAANGSNGICISAPAAAAAYNRYSDPAATAVVRDVRCKAAAAAAAAAATNGSSDPAPAETANGSSGSSLAAAAGEPDLDQALLQHLSAILQIQHTAAAAAGGSSGGGSSTAAAAATALPGLEFQNFISLTCHLLLQQMLQQSPSSHDSSVWSQSNMLKLLKLLVTFEKVKNNAVYAAAILATLQCQICSDLDQQAKQQQQQIDPQAKQQQQQQQQPDENMAAGPAGEEGYTAPSNSSSTSSSGSGETGSGGNTSRRDGSGSSSSRMNIAKESLCAQHNDNEARRVTTVNITVLCDALSQLRRLQHSLNSAAAAAAAAAAAGDPNEQQQQQRQQDLGPATAPEAAAAAAAVDGSFWRSSAVSLYKAARPAGWNWLGDNFNNVTQNNTQPGFWGLVRSFLAADQLNLRRRTSPVTTAAAASTWSDPGYDMQDFGDTPMFCKQAARVADKALALYMTTSSLAGVPIYGLTLQQLLRLACLTSESTSTPLSYTALTPVAAAAAEVPRFDPSSSAAAAARHVGSSNGSGSSSFQAPQHHSGSSSSSGSATAAVDAAFAAAAARWQGSALHLSEFASLGPMFDQQQQGQCLARLMELIAQYYAEHAAAAAATADAIMHHLQNTPAAAGSSVAAAQSSSSSSSSSSSTSGLFVLLLGLYHLQMIQRQQQQQGRHGSMAAAAASAAAALDVYSSMSKRLEACNDAVAEAQDLMDLLLWCTFPAGSSSSSNQQQPGPVADLLAQDFTRLMYIARDDKLQQDQRTGKPGPPDHALPGIEPATYNMLGYIPEGSSGAEPADRNSYSNVDLGNYCDGCGEDPSNPRGGGTSSANEGVYVCMQCGASMLCRKCFSGADGRAGLKHVRNHCSVLQGLFTQQCEEVGNLQQAGEIIEEDGVIQSPSCRCSGCKNARDVYIYKTELRFKFSPLQQLQVPWWKALWQQQQHQQGQQQLSFAATAGRLGLPAAWSEAEPRLQFITRLELIAEMQRLSGQWQRERFRRPSHGVDAAAVAAPGLRAPASRPPRKRLSGSVKGLRSHRQQQQQQQQRDQDKVTTSASASTKTEHSPDQLGQLESDVVKDASLDQSKDSDQPSLSTWGNLADLRDLDDLGDPDPLAADSALDPYEYTYSDLFNPQRGLMNPSWGHDSDSSDDSIFRMAMIAAPE